VWAFAEGAACRRATILRHFGDRRAAAPDAGVPCCDVCDPSWVPAAPAARARASPQPAGRSSADLDASIVSVVESASPPVGRTRTVEILRGGRSRALVDHGYDGMAEYGTFDHLGKREVLARVDELLEGGRLRCTGGAFPKLGVVDALPATCAA
jgi:ATP-dependent DNA helicase RecQ